MHPSKIKSITGQGAQDIKQSVASLEVGLEEHKRLMAHYLGTEENSGEGGCPCYKIRYKAMLKITIEELEKTKRSFKSQRVEGLRKRLIQELADIE
jgi:hypothetical protein